METFGESNSWKKHIENNPDKVQVFRILQNIFWEIILRRTKKSQYKDFSSICQLPEKHFIKIEVKMKELEAQVY